MRLPLRTRLMLTILTVLLAGMGLAAALAWLAVERLYLDTQSENLLAQARLSAAALQGADLPLEPAQPYEQTANVAPGIHARILGEQGAVLVGLPLSGDDDNLVPVPPAEQSVALPPSELLKRPEIQSALQGTPATAVRRVPTAGNRRVLYAAAPLYIADGDLAGVVYLAMPLPSGGLPVKNLMQLACALLAAVLLAGLAGSLLTHRLAQPLEQLAQATAAVAAGDLEQQAPVESKVSELYALGQAFNAMTDSLRRSDQARNAFIADVTHELRTPLTVIKGTIETLQDGALDDVEGRGPLLVSMERETGRLIRLVNDLLVLARADAGALQLNLQTLDLAGLARLRCEGLSALATRRQVVLRVEGQAPVEVRGDLDRLAQVLDNLLDNAIRHAPAGSVVVISLQCNGDEVRCSVSDSGPGIPAEHLPFIFERFYRIDTSRSRPAGGAGLGLAIVKALVQAQGGGVEAQSAVDQGTTVTFWLPAANCHPTA